MQKFLERATIVYLAYMAVVILVTVFSPYRFTVVNENVWFTIQLFITGGFTSLCLFKIRSASTAARGVAQGLPFISLMYTLAIAWLVTGVSNRLPILHGLLCFFCCYVISLRGELNRFSKAICTIANTLLLFVVIPLFSLGLIFAGIGKVSTVRRVDSPNGTYTAVLIDHDQGALGGSTHVEIESSRYKINFLFGHFVATRDLYNGIWPEWQTMTLVWQDEHTLLIDGRPYSVK